MSTEKKDVKLPTGQELTLKQNLKKYRKAAYKDGLMFCKSAEIFSEYLGISKATYTAYEAEKRSNVPDYDTLVAIAAALEVSIDRLMGRASTPDQIRFFLSELEIDFRTKIEKIETELSSGSRLYHNSEKTYFLKVPDSVREYCDNAYKSAKDLVTKNPWVLLPKALCFTESEFEDIQEDFYKFSKLMTVGPLFVQLVFLRVVQAYQAGYKKSEMEDLKYLVEFEHDVFLSDQRVKDQVLYDIMFDSLVPDATGGFLLDENKYEAELANSEAIQKRLDKAQKEQAKKMNDKTIDFIKRFRGGM